MRRLILYPLCNALAAILWRIGAAGNDIAIWSFKVAGRLHGVVYGPTQ